MTAVRSSPTSKASPTRATYAARWLMVGVLFAVAAAVVSCPPAYQEQNAPPCGYGYGDGDDDQSPADDDFVHHYCNTGYYGDDGGDDTGVGDDTAGGDDTGGGGDDAGGDDAGGDDAGGDDGGAIKPDIDDDTLPGG